MDKQLEQEEWRDIAGYEGIYQVSDLGRVRSLDRIKITSNNGKEYLAEIKGVLIVQERSKSSVRVRMSKEGVGTWFKLDKLVATTFLKEPLEGGSLIHIDGDPFNNAVTNLKWGSSNVKAKRSKRKVKQVKTYKTLAELKAAYDSGEISEKNKLNIGEDYTSVYSHEQQEEKYIKVFDGGEPHKLLKEALDLLGIPNSYNYNK